MSLYGYQSGRPTVMSDPMGTSLFGLMSEEVEAAAAQAAVTGLRAAQATIRRLLVKHYAKMLLASELV